MATAGETIEFQADREMEAEELVDFLGMFERACMDDNSVGTVVHWDGVV